MTRGWQTSNNCTFTITERGYLGVGIAKPDGSSNITPSDVSGYYFMVCRGDYSGTMTYEPYTGGIGSPNPDYPQDVHIVTGLNKVTSCGKQLFDKNTTNKLNANYTSGYITSNANERMVYTRCKPNTTYTLSKLIPSSYIRNTIGTTQTVPANGVALEDATYSATSPKTFTTNANAKYLVWLYWSANDTQYTEQQTLDSMMILEGSYTSQTLPTYQAYQGNTFKINLGTNKFDHTKISSVTNGTNDNGVITSSTNSEAGLKNVMVYFSSGAIKIPANTTVYFSADIRLSSSSIGSAGNMNDGNNNSTKTVNPSLNRSYQRYQAYINYSTDTTINSMLFQVLNLVGSFEIKNIMISFQNEINYQPYFEPIELCESTNRQDYIHKIGNDWYLHEAVKKINLDNVFYNGTYLWPNGAWIIKNKITNQTLTDCAKDDGAQFYCNYLETKPYNTVLNGGIGIAPIVGTGEIFVNFGITSSIADNMTFLENHNVKVYYPLATPNEILITEPALINQLNALDYDGQSYYDVTNIMTEGQDLAPIITVDALEKLS